VAQEQALKTRFLAPLAALALSIGGCQGNAPNANQPEAADKSQDRKEVVVGFSQIGAESAWRTANTDSIRSEAERRGVVLKFDDAQGEQANQIKAIKSFVAQGVDVIAFAPVVETGWESVLREAKDAGIPVIVSDRRPAVPDDLYVTFIGSDFIEEGRMAARWLVEHTGGKAVIAEMTGTPGSAPANDRAKGFREVIADKKGMEIAYSQTGNFERAQGKSVMEALLKSPVGKRINVLYAHNDDMAIGAIQAIKEAGKVPGKDIVIVSIDAIHDALQAIVDGDLNCSVECNPLLGPFLFDAIEATLAGKELEKRTVIKDSMFTIENAASALPERKY
jgi:simple sugar transport system substrate-binding protein